MSKLEHREKYLSLGFSGPMIAWRIMHLTPSEYKEMSRVAPPGCKSGVLIHHTIVERLSNEIYEVWKTVEPAIAQA